MYRFVFYVTAVLTKHLIFKSFLRVFHPTPEGPTKAQKKAAAITIQRFVPFFCSLTLFVHWISLEDLISLFCYITSVVFSSVFFTYLAWFRSQKKLPNRPLLSSKNPHFRNEAKCTAFLMKMSFIWVKWKFISKSKAEHLTSFWYRGPGEPGNGLFATLEARGKLGRVNLRKDFWDCH